MLFTKNVLVVNPMQFIFIQSQTRPSILCCFSCDLSRRGRDCDRARQMRAVRHPVLPDFHNYEMVPVLRSGRGLLYASFSYRYFGYDRRRQMTIPSPLVLRYSFYQIVPETYLREPF